MKNKNVYTITEDNITTLDWRNMNILKRIEVGLKLIFLGRIKIIWIESKYTNSQTHSKEKSQ